MIDGPEVSGATSYVCWTAPSGYTASSLFEKQVTQNDSPPRREDDKDGHYKFELGENLTSRCNFRNRSLVNLLLSCEYKIVQYIVN